ncbi:MAG: [FeFe] hydrogenase H-cluster radical SAM maturase HydE [Lentimicrobiaceae bacterium]|nr:[FeFe] hydrogenase H-cluster radical SAM maturase HydE [Lentimicrobiaceae bacterium]
MEKSRIDIINHLADGDTLSRDEWMILLSSLDDGEREYLRVKAQEVAVSHYGKGIFVRALLEISSYCKNNCYYCGIRASNRDAQRYRLSKEEILECCKEADALGFNTFVLQGGEDPVQNDAWVVDVVKAIRAAYPEKAITLSVGERSAEAYAAFKEAGANRFLLRHETRNDEHYSQLHPSMMSSENRRQCLMTLKRLGFQTGSGMMIGSPGQTDEHLYEDIRFLEELQPQMIGIGPFLPATNTPFENHSPGSADKTILMLSLLRLRFPNVLLPATTALATLCSNGMERAISAGANVVMPNVSPVEQRKKYSIYDNKKSTGAESAQQMQQLENRLNAIGYHIDYGRGDYRN